MAMRMQTPAISIPSFARYNTIICRLVEKPMALRLADADAMIAACRDAEVRLGVVPQRRTDPARRALHDAIRAGELGDLVMGTATVPYLLSR